MDGSDVTTLSSGPIVYAVHATGEYLYWFNRTARTINRMRHDGSDDTVLFTPPDAAGNGIVVHTIDSDANYLYYTDNDSIICRANLDGSNVVTLISSNASSPNHVEVSSSHVYWSANQGVFRANLDGSSPTNLGLGASQNRGLAVGGSYLYYGRSDGIYKADLDGGNAAKIIDGDPGAWSDLEVAWGKLYWTARDQNKIFSSDWDGSNVTTLITSNVSETLNLSVGLPPPSQPRPLRFWDC